MSEITAADILTVDVNGALIDGKRPVEPTTVFIHSRIYRAHPDALCILHTHQPYATAIGR